MLKVFTYIAFIFLLAITWTSCSRKMNSVLTESDNTSFPAGSNWKVSEIKSGDFPCVSNRVVPLKYRLVQADTVNLYRQLRQCTGFTDSVQLDLLMVDGESTSAILARSASISLDYAAKYGISAFSGRLSNLSGSLVRLEWDTSGIRYMMATPQGGCLLLKLCDDLYLLYDKKDLPEGSKSDFE